jgi:putative ABC transport system permease protein
MGDLRHAFRLMRRAPGFTAAAILTLALGVGVNTAVFSLVRAVLLRPLPYQEPDRLVSIARNYQAPGQRARRGILTGKEVHLFRDRATTLAESAVVHVYSFELSSPVDLFLPDGAERLRGGLVTSNFFEVLGVRAALGRLFSSRDDDAAPVAVLSDGYWRRRFAADPAVVGKTVDMMQVGRFETRPRRFTIVGVLPARFRFTYPRETEVWAIFPWSEVRPTNALEYELVGRLRPGVESGEAQAELTSLMRQMLQQDPRASKDYIANTSVLATTLPELARAEARPGVLLLVAVAGVVLLIACINVILLMLARMVEREREIAVRAAIGARLGAFARQLLVESAMLVAVAAGTGVLAAFLLQPVLRALVPPLVPRGDELTVDLQVLAFAGGLSVLLALVCGLAPLWQARASDIHDTLKQTATTASGGRHLAMWRNAVVMVQVAVVLVLLVGAALLLHSFWRLRHVDLGYDGRNVITMEMSLLREPYRNDTAVQATRAFERDLMERVRALPGVTEASVTTSVPMRGVDFRRYVSPVNGPEQLANERTVDYAYFKVMRIPIVAGRAFTEHDTETSPPVAVVSQRFARTAFGDRNPIGEHLDLRDRKPEIVGVAGDVRHVSVTEAPLPAYYLPQTQDPTGVLCLVVRTQGDRAAQAAAIRKVIYAIDPRQPVERITTLDRIVEQTTSEDRFYAVTTGAFAGAALLLALAGLFGVVARNVAERTRELAIRTALGADARVLVRFAIVRGLRPVVLGTAAGLVGAYWLSRLLQRFLFEVSPLEPWAYGAAAALLLAAATVACYLPARRATCVDPVSALRAE